MNEDPMDFPRTNADVEAIEARSGDQTPSPVHGAQVIARVAHEANRAYCAALGDDSQLAWDDAPDWQRISAVEGVRAHLEGRARTPEESHELWMRHKEEDGWTWGPVKDPEARTHPCMMPYHELPPEQRRKDALFGAVVRAFVEVV